MGQEKQKTFPRWVQIVFAITILILLLVGIWFLKAENSEQRRGVGLRCLDIAQIKESQISSWKKDQEIDAELISKIKFLTNKIQHINANPRLQPDQELSSLFHSIKQQHDYFSIGLINKNGNLELNIGEVDQVYQAFEDTIRFALLNGTSIFIDFFLLDKFPGKTFVGAIAPIVNEKQNVIGLVILINDASEYLDPILKFWPTPNKSAETILIKKEGNDVLFLNELRHIKNTAMRLRIPVNQTNHLAVKAIHGATGVISGLDYREEKVIAAIQPVSHTPWYLIVKIDEKEALANWHFISVLILVIMFVAVGFIMVVAKVLQQRNLSTYYQELYRSETALRENMEKHSVTLHSIGDAVISTDAKGNIELMNPVAEELTGWKEYKAIGKPLDYVFHIISAKTRKPIESPVTKVINNGIVVGLGNHTLLVTKDNQEIPIADSGAPIRNEKNEIIGVVLVFRDQSEEYKERWLTDERLALASYAVEHTLQNVLLKVLREISLLTKSSIGFYCFINSDQISMTLEQYYSKIPSQSIRFCDQSHVFKLEDKSTWQACVNQQKPIIQNSQPNKSENIPFCKDDFDIHRELVVPIIRKNNVVAIVHIGNGKENYSDKEAELVSKYIDLTWEIVSQKRTQEALRKSEEILNRTGSIAKIGGWEYNFETGKAIWTRALYEIFEIGFDQEPPTVDQYLSHFPEPYNKQLEQAHKFASKVGVPFDLELEFRTAKNNLIWCRIQGNPIKENGIYTRVQGTFHDISEIKIAEKQIQHDLKEKEVLIRELYHRTKNNMQVISSMLRLQSRTIDDEKFKIKFKEIENKILAMALVHQKLYETKDLSHLNLKEYIRGLVELLQESNIIDSSRIAINFEGQDINVLLDTAMPVGILINEIITNSVKYAFPPGYDAKIDIKLIRSPKNEIILNISDNGVGLPDDFDFATQKGIGIRTIFDLVEYQLHGTLNYESKNGLYYTIVLNEEFYTPRV